MHNSFCLVQLNDINDDFHDDYGCILIVHTTDDGSEIR